jgi:hypothetical protein
MSKEIMLECLKEAKWVYSQYDKEQNLSKAPGAYARPSLAIIAVALYEERMLKANNDILDLYDEDASWLRHL